MKFLVDSNVLSEPTKPAPEDRVIAWLRENEGQLATSSIVLGELEYGILLLPAGKRRTQLLQRFALGAQAARFAAIAEFPNAISWPALSLPVESARLPQGH